MAESSDVVRQSAEILDRLDRWQRAGGMRWWETYMGGSEFWYGHAQWQNGVGFSTWVSKPCLTEAEAELELANYLIIPESGG